MSRRHVLIGGGVITLLAVLAVPAKRPEVVPVPPPVALALRSAVTGMTLAVAAARLEAQRQRTEANNWGRDPFAHAPGPAPEPEALPAPPAPDAGPVLTGISRAGKAWLALIDGEFVRTGGQLASGHTVVTITDDSVTLRHAEQEVTLRLGGSR